MAGFSANQVVEFKLDGTVVRSAPVSGARGVYELGNGNWLATGSAGVLIIDPSAGSVVSTVKSGTGFRFIEAATLP